MSGFDPLAYAKANGEAEKPAAAFNPKAYGSAAEPASTESPDDEIMAMIERAKTDPAFAEKFEPIKREAQKRMGKKLLRDMGSQAQDTMSLGWADDAMDLLGQPERAKAWRENLKRFREQHPYLAAGSSVMGALPAAVTLNPGIGATMGMGAAAGLGGSEDKSAGDAVVGAGTALLSWLLGQGAASGGKFVLGKMAQGAGKLLQKPQALYERAAEAVGKNADDVAGAAKPSSGSKLQRDLASAVDEGELAKMGPEVGGAARAAEKDFVASAGNPLDKMAQDILGRPLSSLTAAERQALMGAMVKGMKIRGLEVAPEQMGQNFDELVRAAGLDPAEASVREAIRRVNQRDPAFARQLELNTWERWKPLLEKMKVDPRILEAMEKNKAAQADFVAGLQNRFGVMGQQGGKGQMRVDAVHQLAEDALAPGAVRDTAVDTVIPDTVGGTKVPSTELEAFPAGAAAGGKSTGQGASPLYNPMGIKGGAPPAPDKTEAIGREGKRAIHAAGLRDWQGSPGGQAEKQAIMDEVMADAQRLGRTADTVGKTGDELLGEMGKPPMPKEPLDLGAPKRTPADVIREGQNAAARLRAINAGKKKLDQFGAGAAILGLPGGKALGGARVLASDAVAGTGRSLEAAGEKMASPESIAKSWLKNPSLLEPIVARGGKMGDAAKWVLEPLQGTEGGAQGFKSRLFILTMQPWFRAEIAAQDPSREEQPEE